MTTAGAFDAREIFAALAHHEVEYVTIGGIAIQAHGGQRLTQDLDIVIAASTENVARLSRRLPRCGFALTRSRWALSVPIAHRDDLLRIGSLVPLHPL